MFYEGLAYTGRGTGTRPCWSCVWASVCSVVACLWCYSCVGCRKTARKSIPCTVKTEVLSRRTSAIEASVSCTALPIQLQGTELPDSKRLDSPGHLQRIKSAEQLPGLLRLLMNFRAGVRCYDCAPNLVGFAAIVATFHGQGKRPTGFPTHPLCGHLVTQKLCHAPSTC